MRVAWFRNAVPDTRGTRDTTPALLGELATTCAIDVYTAANAHDFVWRHHRERYAVTVFELDGSSGGAFMSGYLAHYSDVIWLRSLDCLEVMRHPCRMLIAPNRAAAAWLTDRLAGTAVRFGPLPAEPAHTHDEIVVATRWPCGDEPDPLAMAGLAAGRPVVTFETESTADWPALDPQTWQPRNRLDGPPIAVTLDPRDEAHSLRLAMTRLSKDATLRAALSRAALAWWKAHATAAVAAAAWTSTLAEATALPHPNRHPAADGSQRTREILEEIGAAVDFLAATSKAG